MGGGKSLVHTKYSYKTIFFGLFISFFATQCSKSSDPAVNPVAVNGTCQAGQTKQADGTCKADDGTITCPIGESKNASGNCELKCVLPKILQNGVCVTGSFLQITSNSLAIGGFVSSYKTISVYTNATWNITGTIPTWLSINQTSGGVGVFPINLTALELNTTADKTANLTITATGAPTQTLTVTQVGRELCSGFEGPSVMLYKYLNKTNPNPPAGELIDRNNSSIAFMMAKGCKETNTKWQSSQANFNVLSNMEFIDGNSGTTYKSLTFVSNPWDYAFVKDLQYATVPIRLIPKKLDGSRAGTVGVTTSRTEGRLLLDNCASPSCFIRLDNSFVSLPETPTIVTGLRNLPGGSIGNGGNNTGVDDFSAIYSTDLGDPTKFDPYIKTKINQMFKDFATTPGVTWPSGWEASVLIP